MSAKTLTRGITYLYPGFNFKPCNGDKIKKFETNRGKRIRVFGAEFQ